MPDGFAPEVDIAAAVNATLEKHLVDPGAPYAIAKLFRYILFTTDGIPTIYHHHDCFAWNGDSYPELGETEIRSRLYKFLNQCVISNPKGGTDPYKPNMARVANVLDGLRAASNLSDSITAPAWLDCVPDLAPADIIACANGLLFLPTLDLLPRTPLFYTHNALDFGFDPGAPEPVEWKLFLKQLWLDDQEAIDTLQEIFGYFLTADTSQQKAFLLVGPKRSGKGTIGRVLSCLISAANAVAPTLAGIGANFGLEPLIGKRAGIISDARLGGKADLPIIAERLLSITGEDSITVDRKFKKAWTGRMQIRFLVLTNELPRLTDASGALASRFIVLVLKESFFGREDHGLEARLLKELPAILNWAIVGLARLRQRGYFVQPSSAAGAVQQIEDLGSPIGAFLRQRCFVKPGRTVEINHLFDAWCEWCKAEGRDHPGTKATFGKDLNAAVPGLKISTTRIPFKKWAKTADEQWVEIETETRIRSYEGVGLD
jgi:putative DNA primase/helicase